MIAAQVASAGSLNKIATEWRMPNELAADLVKLALYDVVLYVDGESIFTVFWTFLAFFRFFFF